MCIYIYVHLYSIMFIYILVYTAFLLSILPTTACCHLNVIKNKPLYSRLIAILCTGW